MDVRLLISECESLISLIDEIDYSKPTPKILLRALAQKTHQLASVGVRADEIMFTAQELMQLVKTGSFNDTQVKKFKADHYAASEELLAEINNVKKSRSDSVYQFMLEDTGEKGGAKNKKHHYLKLVEIESSELPKHSICNPMDQIVYETVQLPKPYWFVRPFVSIELSSWRLWAFILGPISLVVTAYSLVAQSLFSPSNTEIISFFIFLSVIILLWRPLAPFYIANDRRIAIAPQWMMAMSQVTAQLESVKLEKFRNNGRPYRKLEFVVYEGRCPICKNKVEVINGKGEFKGRLIGECEESPREHIFSFDHVTKLGSKLRK